MMVKVWFCFVSDKILRWCLLTFIIVFLCSRTNNAQNLNKTVYYRPDEYECKLPFESFSAASSACSCHPACTQFQDCCYDGDSYYSNANISSKANISVILDNIFEYQEYYKCIKDVITNERYWMVSTCPSDWTGSNSCDTDGDGRQLGTVDILHDASSIPVVSPDGVTFLNMYCATCHGLDTETLSPWSVQAECENLTDSLTWNSSVPLEEYVHFLFHNCERVSFLPPRNHSFYSTTAIPCRELFIETELCDVPDNKNSSDAINCLVVAAPLRIDSILFRNRYCAECYYSAFKNETLYLIIDERVVVEKRPFIPFPEGEDGDIIYINVRFVPISITFNSGPETVISDENGHSESVPLECGMGYTFDPSSSDYIYSGCPPGYILNGSDCVQTEQLSKNSTNCHELQLKLTLKARGELPYLCSTNLTLLLSCLPINSPLFIDDDLKDGFSCHTKRENVTQILIEITIHSMKTLEQIVFVTNREESFSSNTTSVCQDIESIEIFSFCSSSELFFACELLEQNDIQWRIVDDSTSHISIPNTSEILDFSEVKLRKKLKFSKNLSVEESFYLHRCRPCPLVTVGSSAFQPTQNDLDILVCTENQALHFSPEMYLRGENGEITLCNFFNSSGEILEFIPQYSFVQSIVSTVGLMLSTIALSFSFITYCVFPVLRNHLAPIMIMTLCACLIIAQVCLLSAGVAVSSPQLCALVSGIGHLFWLTTFSASSVLGFVLNQTFKLKNQAIRRQNLTSKTVIIHLLSCFAIPLIICGTLLTLYLINGERFGITYGDATGCWIGGPLINLYVFIVPVALFLALNLFFFLHVVISLCVHNRGNVSKKGSSRHRLRELLIYIKIFVVLGFSWTVGFVASFTNQEYLWYIFIILTSLQGVFVFLAFTVKSQVWRLWLAKIRRKKFSAETPSISPNETSTSGTSTSTI